MVGAAKVTLIKIGEECKLAITAPPEVKIVRSELLQKDAQEKDRSHAQP